MTVLGLWGVPAATALAASLAFHVVEIVPIGIAGLIVGWREGVGFSPATATALAEEAEPAGELPQVAAAGGSEAPQGPAR